MDESNISKEKSEDIKESILTNELGKIMSDMVSPIYYRSRVAAYLFQAIGIVLQKETDFIDNDFILQIFPQMATWGMKYHEDEYGIIPDSSWDMEQRHKNFLSVMRYTAPITPKKIEDRISAMIGFPVEVRENIEPNMIEIYIDGFTESSKEIEQFLDKILPAHLTYRINTNDYVYSKLIANYKVIVNECETSTVILNNS